MQKLTSLTKDQEARLPAIRDEWLGVGRSTERADRPRAEEGVRQAYIAGGELPPPKGFIWVESPIAGIAKVSMLLAEDAKLTLTEAEAVKKFGGTALDQAVYGQHDAGWCGFYAAMGEFGMDVSKIHGITEVARSAGWWWPFDEVCVISERPTVVKIDSEGRLHSLKGMAIEYADGSGLYEVHGMRVPKKVIEAPETLTAKEIQDERNVEIRRVMIDQFGIKRFLQESDAKMVSTDKFGTLWIMNVEDDEPVVAVQVVNGTQEPDGSFHEYFLRVPSNIKTPLEAVAWTYNVKPELYSTLQVRT